MRFGLEVVKNIHAFFSRFNIEHLCADSYSKALLTFANNAAILKRYINIFRHFVPLFLKQFVDHIIVII